MLIALLMQMAMHHEMQSHPTRIDVSQSRETLTEIPQTTHRQQIDAATLAPATIAYCQRTGRTRCTNEVSSQSGGTAITVCKVSGKWVVNKCRSAR